MLDSQTTVGARVGHPRLHGIHKVHPEPTCVWRYLLRCERLGARPIGETMGGVVAGQGVNGDGLRVVCAVGSVGVAVLVEPELNR